MSSILAALGIYLLANSTGNMLFFAAIIFGMGVCYFWPTMLGFVSENLPKTGAVGINLLGGAGMFAVSMYLMVMGGVYDRHIQERLPSGADIASYKSETATPDMKAALASAEKAAGPDILNTTLIIPIVLVVAFIGLNIYMRRRNRSQLQVA